MNKTTELIQLLEQQPSRYKVTSQRNLYRSSKRRPQSTADCVVGTWLKVAPGGGGGGGVVNPGGGGGA